VSWEDIMRRVLPPIGSVSPHVTGPGAYGAGVEQGRQPPSTIPHGGVDFNYIGGKDARLNKSHPALRSPVDDIVENAGQGDVGRSAIRDKNGFLHEILHTDARHVAIGDPVAAGQLIGTMGQYRGGPQKPQRRCQPRPPSIEGPCWQRYQPDQVLGSTRSCRSQSKSAGLSRRISAIFAWPRYELDARRATSR
jgi:hypothetical protein